MTHEWLCLVAQGFAVGVILSWVLEFFFPRRSRHRKLVPLTGNAFRENMKKVFGVELCPVCNGFPKYDCVVCSGTGVI